ncbi:cobalamin biosynthesis protein [Paenibacillus swuensis]|uniref:Cobalamin biosynthesis protein CobD n=1 Tax=Paenibacillus swuensis TaxID=1178515 RepID=A0A172THB7_9BACL|nr:adenosylcobinamide-phosphate synthase CbiB [Paenibacillus swuensis]ANE46362.1 cobalamin biosynthesis protein [Paenibacillus swuensis]
MMILSSIFLPPLILVAAYITDLIVGDPRKVPHPVVGMGRTISALERAIRRRVESARGLKRAGFLLPIALVGGSFALTWALLRLLAMIHPWAALGAEVWLIATTVAAKGLAQAGMDIFRCLARGDLIASRRALGMVVGRDTADLDEAEITRGAVETVAENIVDGIISPLFYAAIGGAPLAMAYRAVNTLDSMVGYKNERYLHLGYASARLDDVANWLPARLTVLALAGAAFLMRLPVGRMLRTVGRDARRHPSPNSGFPESAVAGALGVQLGGLNYYKGVPSDRARMGDALQSLQPGHIRSTVKLMYGSSALFVVFTALLLWVA